MKSRNISSNYSLSKVGSILQKPPLQLSLLQIPPPQPKFIFLSSCRETTQVVASEVPFPSRCILSCRFGLPWLPGIPPSCRLLPLIADRFPWLPTASPVTVHLQRLIYFTLPFVSPVKSTISLTTPFTFTVILFISIAPFLSPDILIAFHKRTARPYVVLPPFL